MFPHFHNITSTKYLPLETLCKCKTGKRKKARKEKQKNNKLEIHETLLSPQHIGRVGVRKGEKKHAHQKTTTWADLESGK